MRGEHEKPRGYYREDERDSRTQIDRNKASNARPSEHRGEGRTEDSRRRNPDQRDRRRYSRSPRRRSRSRSRSPGYCVRSSDLKQPISRIARPVANDISNVELDDFDAIAAAMGFSGFSSTKVNLSIFYIYLFIFCNHL